jgi:hypothetical protein
MLKRAELSCQVRIRNRALSFFSARLVTLSLVHDMRRRLCRRSGVAFVCSAKTPAERPAAHYGHSYIDRAREPSGLRL